MSKDALTLFVSQTSPRGLQNLDINKVLKNLLDKALTLKRDVTEGRIDNRNRKGRELTFDNYYHVPALT